MDIDLELASELYCLAWFEATGRAQYLTFCTALEVLLPRKRPTTYDTKRINNWIHEVEASMKDQPAGGTSSKAHNLLIEGLRNLKSASITSTISSVVERVLRQDGRANASELAEHAVRLYKKRSRIIHNGRDVTDEELHTLSNVVRLVIMARLRTKALAPVG